MGIIGSIADILAILFKAQIICYKRTKNLLFLSSADKYEKSVKLFANGSRVFYFVFVDHVQFLQMNHAWGDDQALRSQIGRTNSNVILSLNLGTILIVFGILMLLFKQKNFLILCTQN